MLHTVMTTDVNIQTLDNDAKNLAAIDRALENGRIDKDSAEYLHSLYSDSMTWLR